MDIIAGPARGVELCVPEGIPVRPTTGRARKALFDSLGDLTGSYATNEGGTKTVTGSWLRKPAYRTCLSKI